MLAVAVLILDDSGVPSQFLFVGLLVAGLLLVIVHCFIKTTEENGGQQRYVRYDSMQKLQTFSRQRPD